MFEPAPASGLVRVGVIDSARTGAAYERLDECALDVMALVPSLGHVNLTLLHEYEVMLVGCSPEELDEAAFQTQLLRVARAVPAVAITPGGAGATTAARIGFHGFIAREVGPEALTRTVSAVAHGEVAFPRATLAALLQMLSFLPLPRSDVPTSLTPRQQQIVDLIAQGATAPDQRVDRPQACPERAAPLQDEDPQPARGRRSPVRWGVAAADPRVSRGSTPMSLRYC